MKINIISLPNIKFLDLYKFKALQRTNLPFTGQQNVAKLKTMADNKPHVHVNVTGIIKTYFISLKTLWEKEKMQVTSIFSFSHNVFKRLFQHHCVINV